MATTVKTEQEKIADQLASNEARLKELTNLITELKVITNKTVIGISGNELKSLLLQRGEASLALPQIQEQARAVQNEIDRLRQLQGVENLLETRKNIEAADSEAMKILPTLQEKLQQASEQYRASLVEVISECKRLNLVRARTRRAVRDLDQTREWFAREESTIREAVLLPNSFETAELISTPGGYQLDLVRHSISSL